MFLNKDKYSLSCNNNTNIKFTIYLHTSGMKQNHDYAFAQNKHLIKIPNILFACLFLVGFRQCLITNI